MLIYFEIEKKLILSNNNNIFVKLKTSSNTQLHLIHDFNNSKKNPWTL
jgi:hypothetical protein